MLKHELNRDRGILVLHPEGALREEDFAALAATVDPYLDEKKELRGIVVDAPAFPGWENFAGLVSHIRFVREHHRKVRRIAVVTDSKLLGAAPKIAAHFVSAEIKVFDAGARAAALAWVVE